MAIEATGNGQESFSVIQASRDGLPAIIVSNDALNPDAEQERYPWLVTISMPLSEPNKMGLCSEAESERLNDLQDLLLERLNPADYRYAARITWNGFRDTLIYTAKPDTILQLLEQQSERIGKPEISLTKSHDPGWQEYRDLLV
jgi:hypothetical protein